MKILGISAFYHDSAAAILDAGVVVAAAQEERFSRKKHDASFPSQAVKFCLEYAGTTIDELDAIAFYDKPLLKFERLLETYYAFAPQGLRSFLTAIPVWLREKLFLKRLIHESLGEIETYDKKKLRLLFPEHHLSHAGSTYYSSPFDQSAILTIDGVGEWATATISLGKGKDITLLKELRFPHSLGLLYSAFTYFLGFRVNSGEYKLMGLAPYGNPQSPEVKTFVQKIESELISIKEDGSIWLNQAYFSYATGLRMVKEKKWEQLFGMSRREPESELTLKHCNLGLAIQHVTEKVVLRMAMEAKRITGSSNLCLAGGVALNCVANGKLKHAGIFDKLFIQPASGDAGGALGAAQAAYHIYFQQPKTLTKEPDGMEGAYLGPTFSDLEVELMAKKFNAPFSHYDSLDDLCEELAKCIALGQVVGWMQGRMEFGPRALGGRSILADARNPETQKRLNLKIKYRESFRPFAPSVLLEDCKEYFEMEGDSPYMLLVHPVQPLRRNSLPEGYHELPLREKLYIERSDLPAITHIDFSARVQTVSRQSNLRFWSLLQAFKKLTGTGLLVNTSFNVRGEPIVCTPEDAYRCFMNTEMDVLVIGDFLFTKTRQPIWEKSQAVVGPQALD
ncbi:MAG: carbamoyltransferase [Bacteroidota bacterium]